MKRISDTLLGALVQAMPERIPAAPCGSVRVAIFGGQRRCHRAAIRLLRFQHRRHGRPAGTRWRGFARDRHRQHDEYSGRVAGAELPDPRALVSALGKFGRGRPASRRTRDHQGNRDPERRDHDDVARGSPSHAAMGPAWRPRRAEGSRDNHARAGAMPRTSHRRGCSACSPAIAFAAGRRAAPATGIRSQRDPQAVKQDIVDGKISAEAAREEYGVVLAGSDVDLAATQTRRDGLRAKLGPINWTYDRGEQGRT